MKKSMDIIDVYAVSRRYCEKFTGCFIDNIYFAKHYWLFKLRCRDSGKYFLKAEPGVRFHVSRIEPIVKSIDKFTAVMRKYIRGARIESIEQLGWERVLSVDVSGRSKHTLYVEIIPRGFLVLTDGEGKILYANRFAELRDRVVKINRKYQPPPGNLDRNEYFDKLYERITVGKDLVRGIVKGWGLPGYIAEEIIFRAGLYSDKHRRVDELSRRDIDELINTYRSLVDEALHDRGFLVLVNGEKHLYTLYKPLLFTELYEATIEEYRDQDLLMDTYFGEYEKKIVLQEKLKVLDEKKRAYMKSIEEQRRLIEEYMRRSREYHIYVELIVRNHDFIEKLIDCARRIRRERGWEEVVDLCEGVKRYNKDRGLVFVEINGVEIPLDIRLGIWDNVNKYRKLEGVYRSKAEKAEKHLEELLEKLRLMDREVEVSSEVVKGVRPRFWFEKFHWTITSNGFLVIAGRDADQNELLVRKYLEPDDIFLHADIHGAPATILKTHGGKPSDQDIREAAVLAACYSRGWRENLGFIDVFWVLGRQVSKKPPSGEYLGKGAFMIYGERSYVRAELRLGIGVEEVCDPVYGVYQRVVVGLPETVEKKSIVYGVVVPGDLSPRNVAEKLMKRFKKEVERLLAVSVNDILYRLPGSSRIMVTSRGKGVYCGEI